VLNRIILIGRLTRDPELKYTPSTNSALATFTIAVDRPMRSARKEKETDFIRIVCWNKLAEICKERLGKGRLVAIDGQLQIRRYETPQGERRSVAEVNAYNVHFLDRPGVTHDEDAVPDPAEPEFGGGATAKFNEIPNERIDEEIDLDEDPFKEEGF
jgi:single-strand DNA-binding protein